MRIAAQIYDQPGAEARSNDGMTYFTTPLDSAAANAASTCDSTIDRSYGCVCKIPPS